MKLSLNWLNDFVRHGLSPENLAERLTMAGHEVKAIDIVDGDRVFEIEVTPNRPDCLSILGLAREVSAIVNKPLNLPKRNSPKIPTAKIDVTIEDKAVCMRYLGVVVDNVSVVDSPSVIKDRLNSVGIRSINNIVDITNFGLFETGQPLHAFDYDKLVGGKIVVRRAKAGEKIVTLDGIERQLNPSILVIADAQRPVAIAGIMGGQATEVTATTKRILLESACFDPILIRRAGRSLGLTSDSAYRFERGVDLLYVNRGSHRALSLILQYAGGTVKGYRDVYSKKDATKKKIMISVDELNHALGAHIPVSQVKNILSRLELKVVTQTKDKLSVVPASFRNDIKAPVDINEELARIIGYDRVPSSLPQIKPSAIASSTTYVLKQKLRKVLVGLGLNEAISYSLVSRNAIEKSLSEDLPSVKVKNPLSLDQEFMRPSLLPSLLSVVLLNMNRGQKDLRLFEIGKSYTTSSEHEVLALVLAGSHLKDWRQNKKDTMDFYDLKGLVLRVFQAVELPATQMLQSSAKIFLTGQGADLMLGETKIASFGKLNREILRRWDIKTDDLYYAEISINALLEKRSKLKSFKALPEFPAMTRDVSLAVKKDVSFSQIETLARRCGGAYLIGLHFLEQYLGDKIPAGQKGLVFSLVYQSNERTLTDQDVSPSHEKVLKTLSDELGAIIR